MRYRLRTLLIVLALGPPVLAGAWFVLRPIILLRESHDLPHYGGGPVPAEQPDLQRR